MIGAVEPLPQVDTSRTRAAEAPSAAAAPTVTHVGPVFRVERHERRTPRGGVVVKDIVRHPGAVTVIAVRDDGMLPLVRNQRLAVGCRLLEFCAGKLEPGEDPAVTAVRELEEETGHTADRIEKLGVFYTSPGFADEIMHVYLATGLRAVPQRLEEGEDLVVELLTPAELTRRIAGGEILDGKTLGAYLLWSMSGRMPVSALDAAIAPANAHANEAAHQKERRP